MAAPTTPILDNFNRPDGAPGPNWTAIESAAEPLPLIAGNKLVGTAANPTSGYWNPTTFGADCEVYATIASGVSSDEQDVWVRMGSFQPSNVPLAGYTMIADAATTRVALWKADGTGFVTQVGSSVTGIAAFDGIWLSPAGNVFTGYTRASGVWTPQFVITDVANSFPAAGNIGFGMTNLASMLIDDFGGGNPGNVTPPQILLPQSVSHQIGM